MRQELTCRIQKRNRVLSSTRAFLFFRDKESEIKKHFGNAPEIIFRGISSPFPEFIAATCWLWKLG